MATANITNIVTLNNKDVEQGLTPCVAAAERHRAAISKINQALQVLEKSQPLQMTDKNLDAAISAEALALREFLRIVPKSNPDAAAKVEYVLSAPDLLETLPDEAMRQFLSSLLTYLTSPSVRENNAARTGRARAPLAAPSDAGEASADFDHLSPDETAHRLRTSIPTLSRWRSNGTGPAFIKSGGKVLYKVSDLDAFEEANRRTKTR